MENTQIIYVEPVRNDIISIEQFQIKKARRRKRVAKRMALRFPLFAVEFMQGEFQGYTLDEFLQDIEGKKRTKYRKGKSPLTRQGRYPLLVSALAKYNSTKETRYLEEAQEWRRKLFMPYKIEFRVGGKLIEYSYPSTIPVPIIKELTKIKYTSREDLESKLFERLRYVQF